MLTVIVACGVGGISLGAAQMGLGIISRRVDGVSTGTSFLLGSIGVIVIAVCLGRIM